VSKLFILQIKVVIYVGPYLYLAKPVVYLAIVVCSIFFVF